MAWWLEGATFRHFGWVRNPQEAFFFRLFEIFGVKEQKEKIGKNQNFGEKIGKCRKKSEIIGKSRKLLEKVGKIEILVEIFINLHRKPIFRRYFGRNIGNFVPCLLVIGKRKHMHSTCEEKRNFTSNV